MYYTLTDICLLTLPSINETSAPKEVPTAIATVKKGGGSSIVQVRVTS